MDVNRNVSSAANQVTNEPAPSQPPININHAANKPGYDLSSFYIATNTPITWDKFDFNDLSYTKMPEAYARNKLGEIHQKLKEKHQGKIYRHANVGNYRTETYYPSANSIDHRPEKWDLSGNDSVAHGTNFSVILYSLANCNLQIIPVTMQLKLLGTEHNYIKTISDGNYYQLCKGVHVTGLYIRSSYFNDMKDLALLATKNSTNFFESLPVVAFGDGAGKKGDIFLNVDNQLTRERVNIRGLGCRNEEEKQIMLHLLRKIYEKTKDGRIKEIYVCTFDTLDKTRSKRDDLRRPDLAYVMASSDTIESLKHPTLNLSHIENNPDGLLAEYHIDKNTPISFESLNLNNRSMLFRIWHEVARIELDEIRQRLINTYIDGDFPCKKVGDYLASLPVPQPGDLNFRSAAFDPAAENNVTHGTNLDVVTHAIANCGMQLVPGIEQLLRLGKLHEYTGKANPELAYLMSVAVRASKLRSTGSNFYDVKDFALKAAQETTNLLSAIPIVIIGDGINQRNMYANLDNEFGFERVNIWLLALKDDTDKRIVMDWFRLVGKKLGIEGINQLMFCTFDDLDNCHWEKGYPVRPNLAALMAKSHRIT
ncbi:hypothetical protein SC171_17850 [Pantoea cypripedii]|uniref:hypothetical protein n=1 Tax=Pantoea cypripedii TaxID=55209 RepID=UPI002FC98008